MTAIETPQATQPVVGDPGLPLRLRWAIADTTTCLLYTSDAADDSSVV